MDLSSIYKNKIRDKYIESHRNEGFYVFIAETTKFVIPNINSKQPN
jgi:hypothetical protein